jgi:hypothetical protein
LPLLIDKEIIMNASKYLSAALVAVAALSASSAFAADDGGLPVVNNIVTSSTVSRAEVQTDLQRAAKSGQLFQNEARNYGENQFAGSQVSRDQVRAELSAAAKAGTLDDLRS